MKKLLFLLTVALFFMICNSVSAQQFGTLYVAAKSGLNMRENPDANSSTLEKIPYGTKISLIQSEEALISIVTEGMTGYWQKVKYKNKTGYIVDSYLLPWPPPKVVKSTEANPFGMKNYLAQVTTLYGKKLVVKSGKADPMNDMAWELNKQLYTNGAEWHNMSAFESGSDEYFLPGLSIEQGFLLARLIPEFREVFGENDAFPTESKTFKKGDVEYIIRVEKQTYGEGENTYSWLQKISVEFSPGAIYTFEIFKLGTQLVISFSGGV